MSRYYISSHLNKLIGLEVYGYGEDYVLACHLNYLDVVAVEKLHQNFDLAKFQLYQTFYHLPPPLQKCH